MARPRASARVHRKNVLLVRVVLAIVLLAAAAYLAWPQAGPAPPPLRISVTADRTSYAVGTYVHVVIRVENPTNANVTLTFPTVCHAAFQVLDAQGTVVYAQGTSGCYASEGQVLLEPGGTREYPFTWLQSTTGGGPVPAGRYRIVASLPPHEGPDAGAASATIDIAT